MYWLRSFLGWSTLFAVVGSTVWVAFDSRELRRQMNVRVGGTNTTSTWVLLCLVLWIVFFPMYLVQRARVFAAIRERATDRVDAVGFCEACGTARRSDASFCPGCGLADSNQAQGPLHCSVCAAPIERDTTRFCTQCGAPGPKADADARRAWAARSEDSIERIRTHAYQAEFVPGWYQRWYAIVAFIAIGLLIARGAAANPATGGHIDRARLEAAIQTKTQQATGSTVSVTCPDAQPLRTGYVFFCTISIDGQDHTVNVAEQNGNGDVRWLIEP